MFAIESFSAYVPTTYINGNPYEQKNMLTTRSKEKYIQESEAVGINGGIHYDVVVTLHEKVKAENFATGTNKLKNIESFVIDGTSVTIDKNTTNPVVTTVTIGGVDYVSSLTYTILDAEETTHKVEIVYTSDATQFTSYKSFDDYKDNTTFNEGNPDYAGTAFEAIAGCTICASFDDRIFLAGNPKLPNTIFYSQRDLTGYNNPTYFGVLNYNNLGTSNAPITALVPSANVLYALKDDSATDPTMYVLTGQTTEYDLIPRVYTVESGLPGIGCKGAACNFLDDIVFMSKNGVIGIDKQAVNLERTLGDRSALINGRLTREDPTKAVFAEWEGYLAVLFTNNGHLYLADSRAYTQGAGYEWYFVDSVGSWEGDADGYEYCDDYLKSYGGVVDGEMQASIYDLDGKQGYEYSALAALLYDRLIHPLSWFSSDYKKFGNRLCSYPESSDAKYKIVARGTKHELYSGEKQTVYLDYTVTEIGEEENVEVGNITIGKRQLVSFAKDTSGKSIVLVPRGTDPETYYQIKPNGEKVGGTFHPATCMVALNDRILFGTADGKILTFNTDKRGVKSSAEGTKNLYPNMIRPEWYSFCGHRIESYVETEDDDAGIANATKDTVKRSAVVDMKALLGSRYRITTYTDQDGWSNDNAATGAINDFSNVGFEGTNYKGDEHVNVQIRERARKWVHKRYKIESNGFNSPFGLYRITYNFEVNGRIK
ncbi:MAG: hypothetical protein J5958_06555 [Clostridia bacterium]|nr:hypothetical protein [Clostridia bacterium]